MFVLLPAIYPEDFCVSGGQVGVQMSCAERGQLLGLGVVLYRGALSGVPLGCVLLALC